jgi:hypothetical protein
MMVEMAVQTTTDKKSSACFNGIDATGPAAETWLPEKAKIATQKKRHSRR